MASYRLHSFAPDLPHAVIKPFLFAGRQYVIGDRVEPGSDIPERRFRQLFERRNLYPIFEKAKFIAARPFLYSGRQYSQGGEIKLHPEHVQNFLCLRMIKAIPIKGKT